MYACCVHTCIYAYYMYMTLYSLYTRSHLHVYRPIHTHIYNHRFLYLSCNCSMPAICGLALDTLTNLAPFILLPIDDACFSITSLLFTSVHQWILSSDKMAVLRGTLSLSLYTHTHTLTHTLTHCHTHILATH